MKRIHYKSNLKEGSGYMLRSRKVLLCGLIFICFLGGWGIQGDDDNFENQLNKVENLVKSEKWREASQEAFQLKKIYQKEKWKYQLLGDRKNYKGLRKEIEKLLASIRVKDEKQANVEVAIIRTLYKDIYFIN
jgi:hypothetical protein